jgi:hypothetical protein
MASFYCDHGCTLYPTAYMSVPTNSGSLPQEGDGKASGTGATPAVSVATMDFTSATAAAGATLAVHGATLTCVTSGATTNQFNAGSGSTLAANLVTAINAATQAPTVTTGGVSSPYLKALVWASSSGAVLTVYSRIASTDLNQSVNASCTLVTGSPGNWTNPPATANFSGGVSGPWSQAFNTAALAAGINASISAIGTYGAWVATMMGNPTAGDLLHMRTGRSSANITINITADTTVTTRNIGTAISYYEIRFDNGTIWNDGNSSKRFTIDMNTGGVIFTLNVQGYLYWHGQMQSGTDVQSGGTVNCLLTKTASDSSGYRGTIQVASSYGVRHTVLEGVEFKDTGAGPYTGQIWAIGPPTVVNNPYLPIIVRNSKFAIVRAAGGFFTTGASSGATFDVVDCLFAFGGAAQYTAAIIPSAPSVAFGIRLIRPKFTGGGGGHHILLPAAAGTSAPTYSLIIEDPVDMGQFILSDSSASLCGRISGQVSTAVGQTEHAVGQFLTSTGNDRTFIIDTPRRLLEWRPASFPTTGLSTLDDGTAFSVRFSVPHTGLATGLVTSMCPVKGIRQIATNTLGDSASLVLTEHILIDASYGGSSYTPTDAEWWIEGTYVSSVDASTKIFTTRGTGTNLTSDSQSWSATTYSPFSGASRTYSKWKITATLTNVKNNTDVAIYLVCAKQPSVMNEWCFIDPQFQLA